MKFILLLLFIYIGKFVKTINFTESGIECLMFSDQQYTDLIRFAINNHEFTIVNLDTTFNLGKFYVSYLTYRNLSLKNPRSGTNPIFIGPAFVHLYRDKATYLRFATELKYYDKLHENKLQHTKLIATDDDESLHGAFRSVFTQTEFILCANHLRKDIKRKLAEFRIEEEQQMKILIDIFGQKKDRRASLFGSVDKHEFNERINIMMESFIKYEHPFKKTNLREWQVIFII